MAARITVSNPITGELREIEVHPGVTVREAAESSRMLPPESLYSVIDENGYIVDQDQAIDCTDTVLHLGPRVIISGGRPDCRNGQEPVRQLAKVPPTARGTYMRRSGQAPPASPVRGTPQVYRRPVAGRRHQQGCDNTGGECLFGSCGIPGCGDAYPFGDVGGPVAAVWLAQLTAVWMWTPSRLASTAEAGRSSLCHGTSQPAVDLYRRRYRDLFRRAFGTRGVRGPRCPSLGAWLPSSQGA
jgi:hypothetical protein